MKHLRVTKCFAAFSVVSALIMGGSVPAASADEATRDTDVPMSSEPFVAATSEEGATDAEQNPSDGEADEQFFTSTPTPTISGTAKVGYRLSVQRATWSPEPDVVTIQWLRDDKPILGATRTAYALVAGDMGKRISVQLTGAKTGFVQVSRVSAKTKTIAAGRLKSSKPKISGTVVVGKKVSASHGSWTKSAKLSYQWYRSGKAIRHATKTSYKLLKADGGKKLTVKVTGKLAGYQTISQTSNSKKVIKRLSATPKPKTAGTVKVGKTLTAKTGVWKPGKVKLKYQWLRNGKSIKHATKSSYKLRKSDAAKKVSVRVTGKKSGYLTVSKVSNTKRVPRVLKASTPRIVGSKKVGSTIHAKAGKWTSGAKLKYQWYRNGKAIKGATKPRYKLTSASYQSKFKVRVSGSKRGYSSETRWSRTSSKVTYPSSMVPSGWNCPTWAPIKGNASSYIYHVPGGAYYSRTDPEICFASEAAAQHAGYRRSKR